MRTGNGRHYLMLGATADGTTVQLAFDVTEAYTVRQTQQRAYHTTFVILIAIGAAVSWVTSYLLTRPLVAGAGARQPQLPGARALAR